MDKKISNGCFRPLGEKETRVFLMRHGSHKNNVLTSEAVVQAIATGHALKEGDIDVAFSYSSPSPRAMMTNLKTQEGYGSMVYTHTEARLSDMALEDASILGVLKERVKARLLEWNEPSVAVVAFDPAENFMEIMKRRARDGGLALKAIAEKNPGKTGLATSHCVGRIEATLMALKGEEIRYPARIAEECQIIELIFNDKADLIEEYWLETVHPVS